MSKINEDKYFGAMLGAAIGDVLGWPNEQNSNNTIKSLPADKKSFQRWIRRCGGRFWNHEEIIDKGEYSDDTQLLIATARSLIFGEKWSEWFSTVELPAWLSYERGGGGATKRAAELLKVKKMPWKIESDNLIKVRRYFEAGGNGVAMRILPHIFNNEDKEEKVIEQVFLNGIFTHGHPRALIGAMLYCDALIYILNNQKMLGYGELIDYLISRKDYWGTLPNIKKIEEWYDSANIIYDSGYLHLWEITVNDTVELLEKVKGILQLGALDVTSKSLESLGCFDKKVNGSGIITSVAAIYIFSKYASHPSLGIVEVAYLESADTDTLASMVGGLFGLMYGTSWILPEWFGVQDAKFLRKIVRDMCNNNLNIEHYYSKSSIVDSSNPKFKSILKESNIGERLNAQPFNNLTIVDKRSNRSGVKNKSIKTVKLMSDEGQSIFIKTYEKVNNTLKVINIDEEKVNVREKEAISNSNSVDIKSRRNVEVTVNANKLRSFANVLPEDMPTDQYLFLISDVMKEIERTGRINLDSVSIEHLKKGWKQFKVTEEQIYRILRIIDKY